MKGVYGSANQEKRCPECGSSCGAKVKCQDCGTVGCVECVGTEKPHGCYKCGKGPIVYID